jgi:hypothetical protein
MVRGLRSRRSATAPGCDGVEDFAADFTSGCALRVGQVAGQVGVPVVGELAALHLVQLVGELGVLGGIGGRTARSTAHAAWHHAGRWSARSGHGPSLFRRLETGQPGERESRCRSSPVVKKARPAAGSCRRSRGAGCRVGRVQSGATCPSASAGRPYPGGTQAPRSPRGWARSWRAKRFVAHR